MNSDALSIVCVFGVVLAMVVDGRAAVVVATITASLALAPTAAYVAGQDAALGLVGACAATVVISFLSFRLAHVFPAAPGLNPLVPMFSEQHLFGPRSARVAIVALALPCASWMSFNVSVLGVALGTGVLFPAAYTWICGVGRLLVLRTVEDMGVGVILVMLGLAMSWATRGGTTLSQELIVLLGFAPATGAIVGWLTGRQVRGVTK